jgi:hypothetical protein
MLATYIDNKNGYILYCVVNKTKPCAVTKATKTLSCVSSSGNGAFLSLALHLQKLLVIQDTHEQGS